MAEKLIFLVNIQYQIMLLSEQVDKIKDLGVYFDPRLKFDEHIDIKISKAYQMLGIIKKFFYLFNTRQFCDAI